MKREIKKYLIEIGKKGGSSKSLRKKMASRKNLERAREVKKSNGEVQNGPDRRNV